jgi:hypothetical protein
MVIATAKVAKRGTTEDAKEIRTIIINISHHATNLDVFIAQRA